MIIAIDLDHTLLNNKSILTEYTINILKEMQKRGHLVCYNTARSKKAIEEFLPFFKADYYILNGGNLILDTNLNSIYEARLTLEETRGIINFLKGKDCKILVELGEGFITDDKVYSLEHENSIYDDFNNINIGAFKIVYDTTDDNILNELKTIFNLDIINYKNSRFNKISKFNKANGNKVLKELIKCDKVISFGDDYGDIEMLLESDIPVCMKNSQEELFQYKFNITEYDNDHDGVAKYLEKYFLNEKGV